MDYPMEPYKIKVVEPIAVTSREERTAIMRKAGYNVFNVPAEKVTIDLLTDSGTSAMSDYQWAGLMLGDESYAGSRNYFHFEKTIRDLYGFRNVIPAHQGRVAENLLFSTVVKPGDTVPNNIHFDTTQANVEHNRGIAANCVIDEGLDPRVEHPFKGNMDLGKLERLIQKVGVERVPICMLTITNNSGGGQPVSLENIAATRELLNRYGIPLYFDACRFAENCYFIKKREPGYADADLREIARKIFSYGDGCTMSAKKDGLVNIGGFLCTNDGELAEKITNMLILIEGFPTYGGMAGRDLEAIARGLEEVMVETYLEFRINQVRQLGEMLEAEGVPILKPVGGHAVFLDAKAFLPHIPPEKFPAQALTCELYTEGGIRGVEIGGLMFGHKDPETGNPIWPELEMVRLAVPRRVYTTAHMQYVAEMIGAIYRRRDSIRGLRLVHEAPQLRHFTARLEPL
ncbi:MAG: tryptophanase [Candidatus Eisenbacteria bacterium]|nr:tryptophanase [Candidatus Eisenbacteria bacterium]